MKILILSKEGNGVSLGWKLSQEGHDVSMWIKDHTYRKVGDGFVKKTENWVPGKDVNLIIFDDADLGESSQALKAQGFNVWGGSKWSDEIESDRGKGQKLFKEIGMTVIPSHEFKSVEEALSFVQKSPKRYVVKPSGHAQDEKSLTYVGKEEDGSDLIATLQNYKDKWSALIEKVEIQEVKTGIEVAVGGFFNGKDFLEPILVNFEHKKLMNGNIGPASGEMGTSAVWMNKNRIYKESLGRCVKKLSENKYIGYFDINCIAEGKTLWPLEVTSRFGYPTTQLQLDTFSGNLGDFMLKVSRGQISLFSVSNPYIVCVVVATPPYPLKSEDIHHKYSYGQEVIFKSNDRKGYWPSECVLEGQDWVLAGDSGYSVVVTGSGKTLQESRNKSYQRVNNLALANSFWRTDIGEKTEDQLKTLLKDGWFQPSN